MKGVGTDARGGDLVGGVGGVARRSLARLVEAGIVLGSLLLAAGSVLGAFQGGLPRGSGGGTAAGSAPELLLRAGILVLIGTPVARVAAAGFLFARENDRRALACCVAVLLLLALATLAEW